jgi:hypothetical protein
MTGLRVHKELTVRYSRELIQEFMDRREVESTIPFLAVAMRCATSRREFRRLRELLTRGIAICTEHISQDQSCHRDALSAYTLSRLIDMHATASEQVTFRYFFQKNYNALRCAFTSLFKKNTVVPMLQGPGSFDNVNTVSGPGSHQHLTPTPSSDPFPSSNLSCASLI